MMDCLICFLASGDFVKCEAKINEFENMNHFFSVSRERQLIEILLDAVNGMNSDKFSMACYEYDRISPLSSMYIDLLNEVKRNYVSSEDIQFENTTICEEKIDLS